MCDSPTGRRLLDMAYLVLGHDQKAKAEKGLCENLHFHAGRQLGKAIAIPIPTPS